jgi:hypothetical protein
MIIDIGDVIYWEGVPHKVREIESTFIGDIGFQTISFQEIFGEIKPKYTYMTENSVMYNEIMEKFYKIDNQIMPLSMARNIRIDEILND